MKRFLRSYPWVLSTLAAVGGLLALAMSHGLGHPMDLARDLGIALLIGAVVTLLYEFQARGLADSDTISNTLEKAFGYIVDDAVWNDTRTQVFDREVLRKDALIHLHLSEQKLRHPRYRALRVNFSYKLFGLRSSPRKYTIRHQLDFHLRDPESDLPHFDTVRIDHEVYKRAKLAECLDKGVFSCEVHLAARDGKPVEIAIERAELTHVPGTYNFIFPELTQGIRIKVDKLPVGVAGEIWIWSYPEQKPIEISDQAPAFVSISNLFLPGQCIEIRFKLK